MHKSSSIASPPPGPDSLDAGGGPRARLLPPEEWAEKLKGTALEHRPLDPNFAIVMVVEVAGTVVACLAAITMVHAEGLWTAEAYRGHAGVNRALLAGMVEQLVLHQVPEVLSQSESAQMDDVFERVGGSRVPGHLYVIPVMGLKEPL